jgi:hypothetical protein
MDAFDRFWQWANKPLERATTLFQPICTREKDWHDRENVNDPVAAIGFA